MFLLFNKQQYKDLEKIYHFATLEESQILTLNGFSSCGKIDEYFLYKKTILLLKFLEDWRENKNEFKGIEI